MDCNISDLIFDMNSKFSTIYAHFYQVFDPLGFHTHGFFISNHFFDIFDIFTRKTEAMFENFTTFVFTGECSIKIEWNFDFEVWKNVISAKDQSAEAVVYNTERLLNFMPITPYTPKFYAYNTLDLEKVVITP